MFESVFSKCLDARTGFELQAVPNEPLSSFAEWPLRELEMINSLGNGDE